MLGAGSDCADHCGDQQRAEQAHIEPRDVLEVGHPPMTRGNRPMLHMQNLRKVFRTALYARGIEE